MSTFDKTVRPIGLEAAFASITGSPLWGLKVEEVIQNRQERGWKLKFSERITTPYGNGPLVNMFELPLGRKVIWIPSYGMVGVRGGGIPLTLQRRLFWILAQAKVKVLIVGGTSGTNDWRGLTDESIQPGDFVLPWSFDRQEAMVGRLPSMGIGGILPNLALLSDAFCVSLSSWLADEADKMGFRRVHRTEDVHVVLQSPVGEGSFETPAETLRARALGRLMSEESGIPCVFLHGDCVSPLMCRHLGIHEVYYHIPVNWAEGHPAAKGMLTESLDDLYVEKLPQLILGFENQVLETIEVPSDCTCLSLLRPRPEVYQEAITA